MIDVRDRYVLITYITPLGMEREEVTGLMLPSEAAMTADKLYGDKRRGVRPDIKNIEMMRVRKAI